MDVEQQLHTEIAIINRTLAAFGVDAGTLPKWTTIAGTSFVAYGLKLGATQRISGVAQLLPELSERLSASRQMPTPVRLREMPIALEVMHPEPRPLDWRAATLRIGAGRLLAGRNYSATPAGDCIIDLDARPHLLVAGTTGSGKSTVLRMLLSSLAYNAAPDELRLVLVDRKNEDLVPFARLPHVEVAAWTADDARAAIQRVYGEVQRRTDDAHGARTRLVLVIDELAQVDSDALDLLARHIVPVGRSKRVHVVAATQHPTVKLIGDKSNYPVRLIGQVVDGTTAAIATGRRETGAELLPGAGAFLYVDGPRIDRLQAYNLTADAARGLVGVVCEKWGGSTPVQLPVVEPLTPVVEPVEDEIARIAALIEPLWRQNASKSAMCREALAKPYAGSYAMKIDRAIARLEAAQPSTTTTPERQFRIVGEVEAADASSSSRAQAPILRMGVR